MKVTIFLIPNYALENKNAKVKIVHALYVLRLYLELCWSWYQFKMGFWWTVLNILGLLGSATED